jgi:hypothetical protein
MRDRDNPRPDPKPKARTPRDRLAAALRANIAKRKLQAKAREGRAGDDRPDK